MAITDKQVQAAKGAFNAYPELTIEELPNAWRAALEAAAAAAWCDDMTKAPKDGTRILVDFGGLGVREVSWTEPVDASFEIWCVDDNKHGPYAFRGYSDEGPKSPRRWRYLPEPPK